jgi:hypothetical protein
MVGLQDCYAQFFPAAVMLEFNTIFKHHLKK